MKAVVLICSVGVCAYFLFNGKKVSHPAGVMAPVAPMQKTIDVPQDFKHKEYIIKPLATFRLVARVLSKKKYYFDKEADLSPVDLALGWGAMSDTEVLKEVSISQRGRWYYWNVKEFPIPRREIETHSANMHLIPATESVKKRIKKIGEGHIVEIEGELVEVRSNNSSFRWKSSLSRNDTGANACEVVWVEKISIRSN